ncbi:MAG: S8 family serine peptidase [Bifidobacteriaceae bacterium]|nr:S8 family serine peptidase [Bifidobacteriaceae bacterium]
MVRGLHALALIVAGVFGLAGSAAPACGAPVARHSTAPVAATAAAPTATSTATPAASAAPAESTTGPALSPDDPGVEPDRVVAVAKDGVASVAVAAALLGARRAVRPARVTVVRRDVGDDITELAVAASAASRLIRTLVRSGRFAAVDYGASGVSAGFTAAPNDPGYQLDGQWGLQGGWGAHFNDAWPLVEGAASAAPVAVIDTGFTARFEDAPRHVVYKRNMFTGTRHVAQQGGEDHGDAVVGVIAARTDNAAGIAGATWDGAVMEYRIQRKGSPAGAVDLAAGTLAIADAVQHGAKVINLSWGTTTPPSYLRVECDRARGAGVLVVAAAGNDGRHGKKFYPAAFRSVLSVGALTATGRLASFSNAGADMVAPGSWVTIMTPAGRGANYTVGDGTSFAAPLVAAAASLMLRARPDLSPAEVEHLLKATARDVTHYGRGTDKETGHGALRADLALEAALAAPPTTWITAPAHHDTARVGHTYAIRLGTGDTSRVTCAEGRLPKGVRIGLSAHGFYIKGKPKRAGVYRCVLRAQAAVAVPGVKGAARFALRIKVLAASKKTGRKAARTG